MHQFVVYLLLTVAVSGNNAGQHFGGKLSSLHHGVRGDVYAVDERTLVLKNFAYDGTGPDAFIWVGRTGTPKRTDEATTMILAEVTAHAYVFIHISTVNCVRNVEMV